MHCWPSELMQRAESYEDLAEAIAYFRRKAVEDERRMQQAAAKR